MKGGLEKKSHQDKQTSKKQVLINGELINEDVILKMNYGVTRQFCISSDNALRAFHTNRDLLL